ncbi:MAG TPA: potassium channel family protein [Mycobacteriales bacterium]|nr:potassium channel family protein [Mycobacteriales bacterium]
MSRKAALVTIASAVAFDLVGAIWFAAEENISVATGLYWSVTTATTVGYGDITPHTHIGRLIAVLVMLTVIPLFAATFSLLTTSLTSMHASKLHAEALAHIHHLKEHLGLDHELPDHLVPPHLKVPAGGAAGAKDGRERDLPQPR